MGRSLIKVERTKNDELVKRVVFTPEIWECIAEDGFTKDDYSPDMFGECWIVAYVDGDLAAAFNFRALNSVTLEGHAHVIKEKRAHSLEIGKEVMRWVVQNTNYVKIVAQTPECFPNVVKFLELLGFKHEGINRKSYLREGEILDQICTGITLEEMKCQTQ